DWDADENFEFAFDVAVAPEIELAIDEKDKVDYYSIKVTDEIIEEQITMIKSQLGQSVDAEQIDEESMMRGDFVELNEQGEEKPEGIRAEGVLLSFKLIKDEEVKKQFEGKKKEDVVTFDPVAAYQDRHEV